jgi:hypothetical protein
MASWIGMCEWRVATILAAKESVKERYGPLIDFAEQISLSFPPLRCMKFSEKLLLFFNLLVVCKATFSASNSP